MVLGCATVLYVATGTLVQGLYHLISSTTHMDMYSHSHPADDRNPSSIIIDEAATPFLHGMEKEEEEEDDDDDEEEDNPISPRIPLQSNPFQNNNNSSYPTIQPKHRNLQCFLQTCKVWYTTTWILSLSTLFFIFCFFPKAPQFNVCSDQLAWKSIIDGITSLKVEASFEILISIYNPNRLSLIMDGLEGKFKHDGDDIGIFTLPPSSSSSSTSSTTTTTTTIIYSQSITDVLITCTVVPDKWEALGIISEYYKGTLVLDVTAGGIVRIPSIGMSFPVKVSYYLVPVSKDISSDRHLCSCPEWKDVKTIQPHVVVGMMMMNDLDMSSSSSSPL